VRQILAAVRIPVYRACLTTIYACGLRLLEGTGLQVPDVDGARMLLHIHGKSKKDRYVPLHQPTLQLLRAHWRPHPLAVRIVTLGNCFSCECWRRNASCPHDHESATRSRLSQSFGACRCPPLNAAVCYSSVSNCFCQATELLSEARAKYWTYSWPAHAG